MKVLDIIVIIISPVAYVCQINGVMRDGVTLIWAFCFIMVSTAFVPALYRITKYVWDKIRQRID